MPMMKKKKNIIKIQESREAKYSKIIASKHHSRGSVDWGALAVILGSIMLLITIFATLFKDGNKSSPQLFIPSSATEDTVTSTATLTPAPLTPTPTPVFYQVKLINDTPSFGNINVEPADPTNTYEKDTTVTITAIVSPGHKFDYWHGDATGSTKQINVKMDSDKTISAIFSKVSFEVNVDAIPTDGGSVSISPYVSKHEYGSKVTITAKPSLDYAFKDWSGDAAGSQNPLTITVDGTETIIANFVNTSYNYTISVYPPGTGSISHAKGTFSVDSSFLMTASPFPGYSFSSWSGDVSGSKNPIRVTMDSNKVIVANFTKARYTLTASAIPYESGRISPFSGSYNDGESVTITAIPNAGRTFVSWAGDITGTENPKTITITKDMTIIANFSTRRYSVSVSINPSGAGHISPSTHNYYDSGAVVELTANPYAGYAFISWSGSISSQANPVEFKITENMRITAQFLRFLPITPIIVNQVTIDVSSKQAWIDTGLSVLPGDTINIIATGEITYDSDGNRSGPDGTVNISGNLSYLVTKSSVRAQALVGNIAYASSLDGKGFFVGSNFSSKVPISNTTSQTGKLFLGFNDGFIESERNRMNIGAVTDNSGSFTVRITIT